jgi:hypothetical protein
MWITGITFDLIPQLTDVNIQYSGMAPSHNPRALPAGNPVSAPDLCCEAEYPTVRILSESNPVADHLKDFITFGINSESADHLLSALLQQQEESDGASSPPEPGRELPHTERLGNIIISTEFQADHFVNFVVFGSKHYDRGLVMGSTKLRQISRPFLPGSINQGY